MQAAVKHNFLYTPLYTYHIEAYFGVQERTARKRKKEIVDYFNRKSSCLFLIDLYNYDAWEDPVEFALVLNQNLHFAQRIKFEK
ncbi:hypothetical protein [Haloflavibacter putidus]|uniref:Uncharacterized protein n=1 Tax=Haloflavibacter putidus TaxID=2576776 RepID=A0A507ZCM0_9FLAO|nr:hypothetical protein [Haloflavibacter putidus]TQD33804.1 hypothetical protein FKR84_12660 [Haloflavibacter putidus]